MAAVHQFIPTFEPGAVGAHALQARRALREQGYESEIFAEHFHPAVAAEGRPYADYGHSVPARRGDVLIYQFAIGSVVADFLLTQRRTLVVDHHNLTPERYFEVWEPPLVHGITWGRIQLRALAPVTALGLAVSEFNRAELEQAGYARTAVLPILFDPADLDAEVDRPRLEQLRGNKAAGGVDLLFVGRVSPNKCQHDLIKFLAAYRRLYDPKARLHLVGGSSSAAYRAALEAYVDHLDLAGAVFLHGPVSPGALAAHYRAADAFVCLSEHEGFCVPLLEAWHHRLPVVALAAAAVPETVGGAGVLLPAKEPARVAAAVHRVLSDEDLRRALVAAGTARLADFSLERTRTILLDAVEGLIGQ